MKSDSMPLLQMREKNIMQKISRIRNALEHGSISHENYYYRLNMCNEQLEEIKLLIAEHRDSAAEN